MDTVNEHVLLSQPNKLVLLVEIPSADSSQATVTFRLLVEQCNDYDGVPVDVDMVEDVACRVPLWDMGHQGTAAHRAFGDLLARLELDNLMLLPVVTTGTMRAAVRVQARCDAAEELDYVGFCLRIMLIDAFGPEEDDED